MTSGRDWLSVILEDYGVPLHLVADDPVSICLTGITTLEFTLRIHMTEAEFTRYVKVD